MNARKPTMTLCSVLQPTIAMLLEVLLLLVYIRDGISAKSSDFYYGFTRNAIGEVDLSVVLITTESQPVSYFIEAPGLEEVFYHNGTLTVDNDAVIDIPDGAIILSHTEQHKGIHVGIQSEQVTLIGQNLRRGTIDSFLVIPITATNITTAATNITCNNPSEYVYYGVSIDSVHGSTFLGIVLIVGTENNTQMKLIVPYSVTVSVGNITTQLIPNREYSFVINRLQTVYMQSPNDLTGTKIVADSEVSVISGHETGYVPVNVEYDYPDHLVEQIPCTKFWGKEYYITPIVTRTSTIKVLAAYNFTNVTIYCNGTTDSTFHINEKEHINKTFALNEYCALYADKKVLVVQFTNGLNVNDTVEIFGDPMMTLVPAAIQYLNQLHFSTVRSPENYSHYINIIVLEQYFQPSMISLRAGGITNVSLESQEWVPIVVNNITKAYATQVAVSEGTVHITHANSSALMTAIAYGFTRSAGYGHPGGLNLTKSVVQPVIKTPMDNSTEEVQEGISITFTCEATSYPRPTVTWSKTNETLNDRISISDIVLIEDDRVSIDLTIINATREDTGEYVCTANNCVGNDSRIINIVIPLLPSIKTPLDNTIIVIHEGMNRTFTCEATGYPIPNVTWHRVDGPLIDEVSMSDNILTGDGSVITNLTIANASREDTGAYICVANNNVGNDSRNIRIISLSISSPNDNITALSGENVTLKCIPSDDDTELYWTYQTVNSDGTVTSTNISQSKYMTQSSLFHHLILPIATVNDTGLYTCIVQGSSYGNTMISQAASLTVVPACGNLDRLSYGILWPIARENKMAERFCSDINPSFVFGPTATRRCREDATWSRVDTSQCTISPTQQSTIVLYSTYVEVDNVNSTTIITSLMEQLRIYDNVSSISTEIRILPDRLYMQTNTDSNIAERQTVPIQYSVLAPVTITANVMDNISVENVTHVIGSIDVSSNINEIIELKAVDVCKCVSNSEDLQQSSTVDICIGTSVNPCICNDTGCRCNGERYAGNGSLCARDSDRDGFPDVELDCDARSCSIDECPLIAGKEGEPCQPNVADGCPEETDPYYGIAWPSTMINTNATNNCPNGTGIATRLCGSNRLWGVPIVTSCLSYEYIVLLNLMEQVEQAEGADVAVELNRLTFQLAMASNRTDENTSSYPADLITTNSLLEFSLDTLEDNQDIINSNETIENITDCFSNILSPVNNAGWTELQTTNQSEMLLNNSETFGLLLAKNVEVVGSSRTVESENIAIVAELADLNNITDINFPAINSNLSINNSLLIPASYIQQQSDDTSGNTIPIVNVNYDNLEAILPYVPSRPVSDVLSSQVGSSTGTLPATVTAVQLTFKYNSDNPAVVCAFWNFSLNEGSGGWDTEGVTVVMIDPINSIITCNSTHLTSFAVLVDVSGSHQDVTSEERAALSAVSYIGCGISIICLVVTIVVLLYYRKTLTQGIHNFVHLNLAIALLFALITFVSGIETATKNETACTIVAALLHYFFTAVFTWMLCEGIMLYFLLVKVFGSHLGERRLFYFVLGWGIPVPIVAISAGVAHDQYGHDDFCWVDTDKGALWGFVVPMLAIITVNFIFLLLSLYSLYKNKKHKLTIEKTSEAKIVKTILKATIILLPLLGITWVFGLLAVNQESSVFAWIFTILNSLQGMFIFIFHVVRNEKIWLRILSCWTHEDKYSFMSSNLRSSTDPRGAKTKNNSSTTQFTDLSSSNEMKLKLKSDSSDFPVSTGTDSEFKSFGSIQKTGREPFITDQDAEANPEKEAMNTTEISMDLKVPSSKAAQEVAVNLQ